VPVFGVETSLSYETVKLEVHPDGKPSYREAFQIHTEADAGAIMAVLSARDQLRQGVAIANLLGTLLRNDDGISAEWEPKRNPETGEILPAMDEDGYIVKDETTGQPLYEDPHGDLVADLTLLNPEHEAGSSRRRFAYLMDDPTKRVPLSALTGVAQFVVGRASSRPTRRQQPSTTSGRAAGRTSRAKRPARG
jgi:hypothetical protein